MGNVKISVFICLYECVKVSGSRISSSVTPCLSLLRQSLSSQSGFVFSWVGSWSVSPGCLPASSLLKAGKNGPLQQHPDCCMGFGIRIQVIVVQSKFSQPLPFLRLLGCSETYRTRPWGALFTWDAQLQKCFILLELLSTRLSVLRSACLE